MGPCLKRCTVWPSKPSSNPKRCHVSRARGILPGFARARFRDWTTVSAVHPTSKWLIDPRPYGPIQCCLSMLVNVCHRPSHTQVNLQDDVDQNQQIPLWNGLFSNNDRLSDKLPPSALHLPTVSRLSLLMFCQSCMAWPWHKHVALSENRLSLFYSSFFHGQSWFTPLQMVHKRGIPNFQTNLLPYS